MEKNLLIKILSIEKIVGEPEHDRHDLPVVSVQQSQERLVIPVLRHFDEFPIAH